MRGITKGDVKCESKCFVNNVDRLGLGEKKRGKWLRLFVTFYGNGYIGFHSMVPGPHVAYHPFPPVYFNFDGQLFISHFTNILFPTMPQISAKIIRSNVIVLQVTTIHLHLVSSNGSELFSAFYFFSLLFFSIFKTNPINMGNSFRFFGYRCRIMCRMYHMASICLNVPVHHTMVHICVLLLIFI